MDLNIDGHQVFEILVVQFIWYFYGWIRKLEYYVVEDGGVAISATHFYGQNQHKMAKSVEIKRKINVRDDQVRIPYIFHDIWTWPSMEHVPNF